MRWLFAVSLLAGTACGDDSDDDTGSTSGSDEGTAGSSTGGKGGSGTSTGSGGKGGSGGQGGSTSSTGQGGAGGSKSATGNGGSGGNGGSKGGSGGSGGTSSDDDAGVAAINAADLRVTLDLYLSEHISLAAKTTEAALGAHEKATAAYQEQLNKNGTDLGKLVGEAYGSKNEETFNNLWSAHNGFFVAYTQAVAAKDEGKKAAAKKDLADNYVKPFASTLAQLTKLPEPAITELLNTHVSQTADLVDAQAVALTSKKRADWDKVYVAYRLGFAHMMMIGDTLAGGIKDSVPEVTGDVKTPSIDLRVTLNEKLQEHLYLATFTTGAYIGDRTEEYDSAKAALDRNGTELGDAIGNLYDDAAKTKFNELWSAHNGYFDDYTVAVKAGNDDNKNAAVKNLTDNYVTPFAEFLNSITELKVDDLKPLIAAHVNLTAAVVDAQNGGEDKAEDAAKADVEAGRHMQMLGDPLAGAFAKKL